MAPSSLPQPTLARPPRSSLRPSSPGSSIRPWVSCLWRPTWAQWSPTALHQSASLSRLRPWLGSPSPHLRALGSRPAAAAVLTWVAEPGSGTVPQVVDEILAAVVLQGPSGTELGQQLQRLVTERVPGPGHRPPASSDRAGQAGAGESPPPASSELPLPPPPLPAGPRSPPEPQRQPGRPPTGCMQLSESRSLGLSPSPARPLVPPPARRGGGAAQPSAPLRAPPATRGRRGRGRVRGARRGRGFTAAAEKARQLGTRDGGSSPLQEKSLISLRTLRSERPRPGSGSTSRRACQTLLTPHFSAQMQT